VVSAQHALRDGNQGGVTVPELIERVRREGLATCLAWPPEVADATAPDDYPTAVLPTVRSLSESRNALRPPFIPGAHVPE
jgi:hypothetical protein